MSRTAKPLQPLPALAFELGRLQHDARFVAVPMLDLMEYTARAAAELGDTDETRKPLARLLAELGATLQNMSEQCYTLGHELEQAGGPPA